MKKIIGYEFTFNSLAYFLEKIMTGKNFENEIEEKVFENIHETINKEYNIATYVVNRVEYFVDEDDPSNPFVVFDIYFEYTDEEGELSEEVISVGVNEIFDGIMDTWVESIHSEDIVVYSYVKE